MIDLFLSFFISNSFFVLLNLFWLICVTSFILLKLTLFVFAVFSLAIECDPTDAVFFSNRSACYASLDDYPNALADAQKAVALKPDWSKAYSRLGLALLKLNDIKGFFFVSCFLVSCFICIF